MAKPESGSITSRICSSVNCSAETAKPFSHDHSTDSPSRPASCQSRAVIRRRCAVPMYLTIFIVTPFLLTSSHDGEGRSPSDCPMSIISKIRRVSGPLADHEIPGSVRNPDQLRHDCLDSPDDRVNALVVSRVVVYPDDQVPPRNDINTRCGVTPSKLKEGPLVGSIDITRKDSLRDHTQGNQGWILDQGQANECTHQAVSTARRMAPAISAASLGAMWTMVGPMMA